MFTENKKQHQPHHQHNYKTINITLKTIKPIIRLKYQKQRKSKYRKTYQYNKQHKQRKK